MMKLSIVECRALTSIFRHFHLSYLSSLLQREFSFDHCNQEAPAAMLDKVNRKKQALSKNRIDLKHLHLKKLNHRMKSMKYNDKHQRS